MEVSFGTVIWSQGRYFLYVVLFSMSVIGVAMIPLLMGIRGFLFAFSCAACYRLFGMPGLWFALVLFGIPAFFWYPGLLLFSTQGFFGSLAMVRRRENDGEKNFLQETPVCRQIACGMAFLIVSVMLEYCVVPIIVVWIFRII